MTEIPDRILTKMERYCANQECCIFDVRRKLNKFPLSAEQRDDIIQSLIQNHYIDEDRYTTLFIRSKMSMRQWGKLKLRQELCLKQISKDIIDRHLQAINMEDYKLMMQTALAKWHKTHPADAENKSKIFTFLLSKGYTTDEIHQITI